MLLIKIWVIVWKSDGVVEKLYSLCDSQFILWCTGINELINSVFCSVLLQFEIVSGDILILFMQINTNCKYSEILWNSVRDLYKMNYICDDLAPIYI